jgi:hypothetical protein
MNVLLIFIWVYAAMIAMAFWEAYVEGRNAWAKHKLGWKIKIGNTFELTAYHFYVFYVMWPLLLSLPLVIYGWDTKLFGILLSAYFSGMIVEDFCWYLFNPVVKFREFWSSFSDYYPWIKIGRKKIIPFFYVVMLVVSLISWYFLWR